MNNTTKPITQIEPHTDIKIKTGIEGFDEVIGGGLMLKSCILFAGQPGVGKSTLWLQISGMLSENGERVLYVTGEEDLSQLRSRADRLNATNENLIVSNTTELETIIKIIEDQKPKLLIIDSLQTIYSSEARGRKGTPMQLEHCLNTLIGAVKQRDMIFITVGHSTKNNVIAGLLKLQHAVDVTMFMTNEYDDVRCLRIIKNRYGRSNIGWLLEMKPSGFLDLGKGIFSLDKVDPKEQEEESEDSILGALLYYLFFVLFIPVLVPYYLFKGETLQ